MAVNITNKYVSRLDEITEQYICCLNSLHGTYFSTKLMLEDEKKNAKQTFTNFLRKNHIDQSGDVKSSQKKEFKDLIRKLRYVTSASVITPQSLFVSLISQYDAYVGELVRLIYDINPKLLYQCSISMQEILESSNVQDVISGIIDDKVEYVLRESHEKQVGVIERLIGDVSLTKVDLWSQFVEITQRRNLFVHCQGKVSTQYVSKCRAAGCNIDDKLIGTNLILDDTYFNQAYYVLFCFGIMLGQTVCRILLKKHKVESELDSSLISTVIFPAISEERYDVALRLSQYAMTKEVKHASQKDEAYFILNLAQTYKWLGNEDKCHETLSRFDFSAINNEFLIAKYALEDNEKDVVRLMKAIGKNGTIMTSEAYATWPIFKIMRAQKNFTDMFHSVFGELLCVNAITTEENDVIMKLR